MDSSGKTLSFGFSKIKETKKLANSVIKEDDKDEGKPTDFVRSLEDSIVRSEKPVEDKKPLVIPLIHTNKWRLPRPEDLENGEGGDSESRSGAKPCMVIEQTGDAITDTAIQELVAEARLEQDVWERRDGVDPTRTIPLLAQNKVPEGYETDEKLNVALRPDEAAEADYDAVPIEAYGMAVLRGMGFKESQSSVKPLEAIARPKGMGLGADRSLVLQQKEKNKPGADSKEEQLVMKKGAWCMVQSGKHQGLYAMVEGVDEDNSRVIIKLTLGGSTITLNQLAIKLVTRKEYDKYSKYLNKTKVDEYKAEEESRYRAKFNREDEYGSGSGSEVKSHKHKKHKHRDSDDDYHRHSKKHKSRDLRDDRDYTDSDGKYSDRERRKHCHDDRETSKHRRDDRSPVERREKTHKNKERSGVSQSSDSRSRDSYWLHPHLRVRIIDPKYMKGKFYKSKVVIEDVKSLGTCICKTDDDRLLDDLSQNQLETVIPKSECACVMVVSGKHRHQVGEMIARDKSTCTATIQVLPDKDEILSLDYDLICEYMGNIHHLR